MPSDNIAEPMDDNAALREILGEVRLLNDLLRQRYDDIDKANEEAIADGSPYERPGATNILKTVVTNTHNANSITIYEEGALVRQLGPGETWVSPLNGAGDIIITAEPGNPATASIATYTKEES